MDYRIFNFNKIVCLLFLLFVLFSFNEAISQDKTILNNPNNAVSQSFEDIENKSLEQLRSERKTSSQNLVSPFSVAANLLSLILIMFALAWLYNKYGKTALEKVMTAKSLNPDNINILSSTSIGQGKYLHVIEVDSKKLLIGVTASNITFLQNLSDSQIKEEENNG